MYARDGISGYSCSPAGSACRRGHRKFYKNCSTRTPRRAECRTRHGCFCSHVAFVQQPAFALECSPCAAPDWRIVNRKETYFSLQATGSDNRIVPGNASAAGSASETHRHFVLQPIVTSQRKAIGFEALYRSGWEDEFHAEMNHATRTMIDNWLLYGYEGVTDGLFTFVNCTREALIGDLLPLLPKSAVFEILETVEPDREVLKACRLLKQMGYRLSLDDFDDPKRMAPFLELADFIKIDFRQSNRTERIHLAAGLTRYGALLIAEKIETEEEFRIACWEGFELFQGFYFSERATFAMSKDSLTVGDLEPIREHLLRPGFAIHAFAEWMESHPGVACRVLRRANWLAPPQSPVNSVVDALKLIGKEEFRRVVGLVVMTSSPELSGLPASLTLKELSATEETGNHGGQRAASDGKTGQRDRDGQTGKILTMSATRLDPSTMRPTGWR